MGINYSLMIYAPNFTQLGPDSFVYMVDRTSGLIMFAPAARTRDTSGSLEEMPSALAAVPAAGREIRVWYQCGGGPQGNVAANTLTVLKDPIPGVAVTNPAAAVGGRSVETLENALIRGPQELHSLLRAVSARDFEFAAQRFGAVSRARAITRASLWLKARSPAMVPSDDKSFDCRLSIETARLSGSGASFGRL